LSRDFHAMKLSSIRCQEFGLRRPLAMTALDQHDRVHRSPMPDVGGDLVTGVEALHIEDVPFERLLAIVELLRNGEISAAQAATWAGLSEKRLGQILDKLATSKQ